jgi:hypothetical protein
VEEKTAHEVLGWHHQRGQAENFHKELKTGFGLEQLPCGDSGAHAMFFRIGVLAYNLFIGFKRLACPAAWASQTIATVRWRLVQVAGRILRHAGRVVWRLVLEAEAHLLAHDPPAVLGAVRDDLTRRRECPQGRGSVAGRGRGASAPVAQ